MLHSKCFVCSPKFLDIVLFPSRKQENAMLESVRKSHPRKTPPKVIDLAKDLPLARELEQSYIKLRELCAPGKYSHLRLTLLR